MRLAALLVLLASAAHAQPAGYLDPPDEALVDAVVEALRVEDQSVSVFGGVPGPLFSTSTTASAIADSVRAHLRSDYRPDLLRAALPALQSPAYRHAAERAADRFGRREFATRILVSETPPKKGLLADSLLAVRYVAAAGIAPMRRAATERFFSALIERLPDARAELEAEGLTVDEAIDRMVESEADASAASDLVTARVELAGVPVGEVNALIAYYESPAGAYVQSAFTDGLLDVGVPSFVALLTTGAPTGDSSAEDDIEVPPTPLPKVKP